MVNNVRQLARTLRHSAESSSRVSTDAFRSALRGDRDRIQFELEQNGEVIVSDGAGRSFRIERTAGQ